MIRAVHHVAVSTADLDRLVGFYTDVGFEIVWESRWSDRAIIDRIVDLPRSAARQAMLRLGNAYLEVFEYESPTGRPADPDRSAADHGYTHFCLDVTDIDAEYERLRAVGMTFHTPPPTVGELGSATVRAAYGRDPDGNIIEIQEILDPRVPFSLGNTNTNDRFDPPDHARPDHTRPDTETT